MQTASSSQPHEQGITAKARSNTAGDSSPTKRAAAVPVLSSETRTPSNNPTTQNGGDGPHWAEWALVAVTTVLAIFTYKLWKATGNLVTDDKTNAQRQLRAYVLIESIIPIADGPLPQPVPYRMTIKNSGQTPAYEAQFQAMSGIGPLVLSDAPPTVTVDKNKTSRTTIAPGGFVHQEINPTTLGPKQIAAVQAGTHQFYIYGTIRYRDAFFRERYSNFRLVREPGTHYLVGCNEGNDSN